MCMRGQCEHHLLPFYGIAHVVCVLGRNGVALAAREVQALVARFSKRLQVQVRICLCACIVPNNFWCSKCIARLWCSQVLSSCEIYLVAA